MNQTKICLHNGSQCTHQKWLTTISSNWWVYWKLMEVLLCFLIQILLKLQWKNYRLINRKNQLWKSGYKVFVNNFEFQFINHILVMYSSTIVIISSLNQNYSLVKELFIERSNMTKVNITSDISTLFFHIPVIFIVIIVNISCVILFRTLEENFSYKMVIYDSINNLLYAVALVPLVIFVVMSVFLVF